MENYWFDRRTQVEADNYNRRIPRWKVRVVRDAFFWEGRVPKVGEVLEMPNGDAWSQIFLGNVERVR